MSWNVVFSMLNDNRLKLTLIRLQMLHSLKQNPKLALDCPDHSLLIACD